MSNFTSELVFIPAPGMGHLKSTVELAKLIIQRYERISISIYIINLPINSTQINAYIDAQTRDNLYPTHLKFVTLPPLYNPPNPSSPDFFSTIFELYKPIVKHVVMDQTRLGSSKPVGFVLDMFCSIMIDVAEELNVPSYVFFTSGSHLLNLMFLAQSLADDRGIDVATMFSDTNLKLNVPGFRNQITSDVIPSVFQDKEVGFNMVLNFARRFKMTKGILVNTYDEFESFPIQALLLESSERKFPAIYPVGPILVLDDKNGARGTHQDENESILEWLDSQPKCSVVFVCFGSMGYFDEAQVKEIANGLDRSGYQFIWCLRKPPRYRRSSDSETFLEALPSGFLDRVANRGRIIGWAPQTAILAHPAVGGFVSHCGWNSILESLWFGVPIAAWPLYSEQQLNAFVLVKELGLATEIRMDYKKDWTNKIKGNFLVKAEEIEKGINKLMKMDDDMKSKVIAMSKKGREALEKGGSSYDWLERFIENLFNNVSPV